MVAVGHGSGVKIIFVKLMVAAVKSMAAAAVEMVVAA